MEYLKVLYWHPLEPKENTKTFRPIGNPLRFEPCTHRIQV